MTSKTTNDRSTPSEAKAPHSSAFQAGRALIFGVAIVALFSAGRALSDQIATATAWIEGLGAAGPIAFILLYVVAVVAFVPGSLLTLAAGALFGIGPGTAYTLVAATLGAAAAFLVARYAVRDWVEQRIASSPRFAALDRAIARDGRRIVFLLRLSPVFPFNLLNYALGVTDVRFVDFVVASIGMLPGTLLYVYYGKLAGDVTRAAGGATPPRGAAYYAVLGLGLLATVAVTAFVTRSARRALAEVTND
jgi:uncharacterized membrane protein YdjX (TVP38/TMEM64 family)